MTHNNQEYTGEAASLISHVIQKSMTNFSAYPSDILSLLTIDDVPYGQKQVDRRIRMPGEEVVVSREFNPPEKKISALHQIIDMACLSDRLIIPREVMASDPESSVGTINDLGENFREALKQIICTGHDYPVIHGIVDYPNGTAGTIIRPEMVAPPTTDGVWDVAGSLNIDLSQLEIALEGKGFYGEKLIIAPPLLKSWLTNFQTPSSNTNLINWIREVVGYPIVFTPWIDSDATIAACDVYMVDAKKIHLALGPMKVDSYYVNEKHAWYVDWEQYVTVAFDTKHDGTEWLKGITKVVIDLAT